MGVRGLEDLVNCNYSQLLVLSLGKRLVHVEQNNIDYKGTLIIIKGHWPKLRHLSLSIVN